MKEIIYSYPITEDARLLYFYEKLALLATDKKCFVESILNMGIRNICLYGYGRIGEMIDLYFKDTGLNIRIYDQNTNLVKSDKRFISLDEIVSSDLQVVITPINNVKEISEMLIGKGVSRERLHSLYFLVDQIYNDIINKTHSSWFVGKRTFLITGASFKNKGAQSMLFVTMNELYRKYPDCCLYFAPENDMREYSESDIQKYKFNIIRGGLEKHSDLYDVLLITTAIIDISGYSITSEGYNAQIRNTLQSSVTYGIPLYLMPQSFGPFDFSLHDKQLFKDGLNHAKIVFAREKKGLRLLDEQYNLKNTLLSNDIVIQSKHIDYSNIYVNDVEHKKISLDTEHNVAIIPNTRNYEFGNKREILDCYRLIIEELLQIGKTVYIIPHSNDSKACEDVYNMFMYRINVKYIPYVNGCLEFEELIRNFEFIIGSRYHAIVHALKNGIPCIAIGWEEKYKEVLSSVDQEQYCYNVREGIDGSEIIKSLHIMLKNYEREKEVIRIRINEQQQNCCFDMIGE